jgi:DNA-binding Xre family transcriptional regulator
MAAEAPEVHAFRSEDHPRVPAVAQPSPDFEFCKEAEARRVKLGIKLYDLAEETGIPIQMLKRIKGGTAKPRIETRKILAERLGFSLDNSRTN